MKNPALKNKSLRTGFLVFWSLACTNKAEECIPPTFDYPLDSTLAFQDIQTKGSHNSYHLETTNGLIPEWEYSCAPLSTQLATQGVRQLELDLYYQANLDVLEVLHIPVLDPGSTCETFADCVSEIATFSKTNPAHHPVMVLLEFKDTNDADQATLDRAETILQEIMGPELLILPDTVQGNHPDLKTAIEEQGWPNLGSLRGKTLFVLHESGRLRDLYTENGTSDRLMFPDAGGDGTHSFAAIHTLNNPLDDFEKIQALVKNNHLVRTRADSDLEEGRAKDNSRFLTALASGAHFISTDFLIPTEGFDYWVQIPDGTPSRCNPISAPALCTSEDIENPAWMGRCD
jgi:hypothetical protein